MAESRTVCPCIDVDRFIRTNNKMDTVRYIMAFSVIVAHFNELLGFAIPWPISSGTGVGGFFALSGFLIYRSWERRPRLGPYLRNRALRILPPYFLVVLLCAFGLVAISSLSAREYFLSPQWLKYLFANLSFLNFLEPSLPGVFEGGQYASPAVNGALWTMKVEWCLYLSVPVVAYVVSKVRIRRRHTLVFSMIILLSVAWSVFFLWRYAATEREIYAILGRQFFGQLSFFYIGALAALNLERLLRYKWWVLGVLLAGVALMQTGIYVRAALWPAVDGLLVIWVSMVGRWGRHFTRHDNVSYDMYLFHFPILQLCVYFGLPELGVVVSFVVALLATVVLSLLSWNLVGKRAMSFRSRLAAAR